MVNNYGPLDLRGIHGLNERAPEEALTVAGGPEGRPRGDQGEARLEQSPRRARFEGRSTLYRHGHDAEVRCACVGQELAVRREDTAELQGLRAD